MGGCGQPGPGARHCLASDFADCPRHRVPRQRHGRARGQGARRCAQHHAGLPACIARCAKPADPRRPRRARGRIQCAHRRPRRGGRLRQPARWPHPRAGRPDRRREGRSRLAATGRWLLEERGYRRRWQRNAWRPPASSHTRTDRCHRRRAAQVGARITNPRAPVAAQARGTGAGAEAPDRGARTHRQPAGAGGLHHRDAGHRPRGRAAPVLPGARHRLAAHLPRHARRRQTQRAAGAPGPGRPEQWRGLEQRAAHPLHRPARPRHTGPPAPAVDAGHRTAHPQGRPGARHGHGSPCPRIAPGAPQRGRRRPAQL